MWAYIDESGNTGNRLFDKEQPVFTTAAMLTKSNFDLVYGRDVAALASRLGVKALHANDLGVGRLEEISATLHTLIRAAQARFFFSSVEKRYLAATKVFDTYFDQGENLAVPWNVYWLKPSKIWMTFAIAEKILTEDIAQTVWDCLTATNERTSLQRFREGAVALLQGSKTLKDNRLRQVVSEALQWAIDNPENFTTYMRDKVSRHGHSPNFVAFTGLMDGIEMRSKAWGRPVREIVHDEQSEFRKMLHNWHELWSQPRLKDVDPIAYPGEEPHSLSRAAGSKFTMTTEETSAGLQVIDVALWMFKRTLDGKSLGPNCEALMGQVLKRGHHNDFSFRGAGTHMKEKFGTVLSTPLTPAQQAKSAEMMNRFESDRRRNMDEYAAKKATSLGGG